MKEKHRSILPPGYADNGVPLPHGWDQKQTIDELYDFFVPWSTDINEHLPTLKALASGCDHVTEFGVRSGLSTTALLAGRPRTLVSYDMNRQPSVARLEALARETGTAFVFVLANTLDVEIVETDFLFIDTYHVYEHLLAELHLHGNKARKYIAMHDTTAYGERGQDGGRGLWQAITDFIAEGTFKVRDRYENNCGLTVLERA